MGWTLQGSKVVGSGRQVRAEIDASAYCIVSCCYQKKKKSVGDSNTTVTDFRLSASVSAEDAHDNNYVQLPAVANDSRIYAELNKSTKC